MKKSVFNLISIMICLFNPASCVTNHFAINAGGSDSGHYVLVTKNMNDSAYISEQLGWLKSDGKLSDFRANADGHKNYFYINFAKVNDIHLKQLLQTYHSVFRAKTKADQTELLLIQIRDLKEDTVYYIKGKTVLKNRFIKNKERNHFTTAYYPVH